jgi:uncharacterized repeat protein (TIGR03803 family)
MKALRCFYIIPLFATLLCFAPVLASGQTEKVLYTFQGGADGAEPYYAGVIFDSAGNLYGTTSEGGGEGCGGIGCGTAFELSPNPDGSWTENVIHIFAGGSDGETPLAGLILDAAGNLYGTTAGGTDSFGTVFELSPVAGGGWTENILYTFKGDRDGFAPIGSLVFDLAGNLYGTTTDGGTHSGGTAFEIESTTQGWNKRTIHNFGNGSDGRYPWGNLIFDAVGNLYGTTDEGGSYAWGTAFELSPISGGLWAEHVLHNFGGAEKDAQPEEGLAFDSAGNLYGATLQGGAKGQGTVFELSPISGRWKKETLHIFVAVAGGVAPGGNLIIDSAGNLYGETFDGGTGDCIRGGCGVVFELSPTAGGPWKETILMDASANTDGGVPWGGLTFDAEGNLYGTTYGGSGTVAYYGTVFEVAR